MSAARSTCWRPPGAPGSPQVIETSTSEVYGTPETLPILETHPLNAQSPYAATKVAADQLALAFHRTYGLPVTVLRPFNTYGPRQSDRAVLPTMIRQLLAGQAEIRLGRLDTRRDLTFVSDTVDGFVRTATTAAPRRLHDPARHRSRRVHRRAVRDREPADRESGDRRPVRRPRATGRERGAGPAVRSVAGATAARLGGHDRPRDRDRDDDRVAARPPECRGCRRCPALGSPSPSRRSAGTRPATSRSA